MASHHITPGWATYLRVSDEDKQSPERSFAMQRQRIQNTLLTPSNVPFSREYTDLLSGTKPNRKDYQEMLSDAAAGKFTHLGLYRADRFGRNTVEGLQAATQLMSLGVKIRIANMPGLQPENPDGYFLFLLQMGLAQREVDVLAQRTAGGMEAKMRAGGWPSKAPEGYVNKERQVSSNKYERWVEADPTQLKVLQEAWEMLLTNRYSLVDICEEINKRGYTRSSGRPWAWKNPNSGKRTSASNVIHKIFHNPFYAGWVVSKRFGIKFGEIRGKWEPAITSDQFERGKAILLKHGNYKQNFQKQTYLLRNLLWVQMENKQLKMFGSTPSGHSKSYSYYITHGKVENRKLRIPTTIVNMKITDWLSGITINHKLVPQIQKTYQSEIKALTSESKEVPLDQLQRKFQILKGEETKLGRAFISGKISEEAYDQLRAEWQEKILNLKVKIKEMEFDARKHLDDLDVALILLQKLGTLYQRLDKKQKNNLLQLVVKRIIINREGEIISHELHSPFSYLSTLITRKNVKNEEGCSSESIHEGVLIYRGKQINPHAC
ncbi:MAG: recombinase family protein [Chloroflexi bacterium]|nr:recombinase family protein [Chloroflexota bacterium]MBT4533235.1 recombinase family protein [Chloroflexota bacterium]MBT6988067.1 recombinase family protein [Chloroflexota bacterium]